jgi:hypothetical protein
MMLTKGLLVFGASFTNFCGNAQTGPGTFSRAGWSYDPDVIATAWNLLSSY